MSLRSPSVASSAPSEQERWLAFSRPRAVVGERARLDGSWFVLAVDGRWHRETERYLPSAPDISLAESDRALMLGKIASRQKEAAPTLADIRKDFPELAITEQPDGTWEAKGKLEVDRRKRLDEMFAGVRAQEIEKSEVINNAIENETLVRDSDGYTTTVPLKHAREKAAKFGMRAERKYKGKRVATDG